MLKKIMLGVAAMLVLTFGVYAQADSSKTEGPKASASDSSDKPAVFRPTKEQIRKGQETLIAKKLWNGEATGVYGECRPAIKEYQKSNGLEVNGKFDKPTLAKMGIPLTGGKSSSSKSSSGEAKHSAPFRATKEQIAGLQKVLKSEKMFTGEANGERTDDLKDAVKKYQGAHGLNATGGINGATLEKAGIALTDSQKASMSGEKTSDKKN
jgi:peptidoglycan hydrolase-like protein with peptidoglycan-binding domain